MPGSCSRAGGQCGGVRPSLGSETICPQQLWLVSVPTHQRPGLQGGGGPQAVTQPRPSVQDLGGPLLVMVSEQPSPKQPRGVGGRVAKISACPPLWWGEHKEPPPPCKHPPAEAQLYPSLPRSPGRMPHPRFSLSPNMPPVSHLPASAAASLSARTSSSGSHRESPTLLVSRLEVPQPLLCLLLPCTQRRACKQGGQGEPTRLGKGPTVLQGAIPALEP